MKVKQRERESIIAQEMDCRVSQKQMSCAPSALVAESLCSSCRTFQSWLYPAMEAKRHLLHCCESPFRTWSHQISDF